MVSRLLNRRCALLQTENWFQWSLTFCFSSWFGWWFAKAFVISKMFTSNQARLPSTIQLYIRTAIIIFIFRVSGLSGYLMDRFLAWYFVDSTWQMSSCTILAALKVHPCALMPILQITFSVLKFLSIKKDLVYFPMILLKLFCFAVSIQFHGSWTLCLECTFLIFQFLFHCHRALDLPVRLGFSFQSLLLPYDPAVFGHIGTLCTRSVCGD